MSYWETTDIEKLISEVIQEKEFYESLRATGHPPDLIARLVERKAVKEATAEAVDRLAEAERALTEAETQADRAGHVAMWANGATWLIGALIVAGWFVKNVLTDGLRPAITQLSGTALFGVFILVGILADRAQKVQKWLGRRRVQRSAAALGIQGLKERRDEARAAADASLVSNIKKELRRIIGEKKEPSCATTLPHIEAPGLSEVFEPKYEIATEAKTKLQGMLESMPGGSIGIAGPRGVGKSTLMRAFCTDPVPPVKGRPVLAVLIPAPVNYDARDFILHLFSSLCCQVRKLEGSRDPAVTEPPLVESRWEKAVSARPAIPFVLLGLGALLLGVAGIIAWGGITDPPPPHAIAVSRAFLLGLGFPAATFIMLALGLLAAGALGLPVARRRLPEPADKTERARCAYDRLLSMRFQQSYSAGWSGSLKLPVLEGGVTEARQLAQLQLSLPEIVARFRADVEDLTKAGQKQPYQVIFGIDELDKIGSDEKAHQFLNDIKAVFGIPGCFYLISVSESAMSSFERRGLGFRDAFDSAFDGLVWVNYLTIEQSTTLLRRRVIGLPEPFVVLCHCLSGGLPRDLIRICRELVSLVAPGGHPVSIARAGEVLVSGDLEAKVRAIVSAAHALRTEPTFGAFMTRVRTYDIGTAKTAALLDWSKRLSAEDAPALQADPPEAVVKSREALKLLRLELAGYACYLANLLGMFSKAIDAKAAEAEWKARQKEFEQLANVRRAFEVDPMLAHAQLFPETDGGTPPS